MVDMTRSGLGPGRPGISPVRGTRRSVVFRPNTPQKWAGSRIDAERSGADLKRRHSRRQRGRRPAAGTARRAFRVPGVVGATENRITGLKIGQHDRNVRLADENGARSLQPGGNRAILYWYVVGERREPCAGAHARGRVSVLQREGHAVERSPVLPARQGLVRFACAFTCALGVERNDGVQLGIVGCNLPQISTQHFRG